MNKGLALLAICFALGAHAQEDSLQTRDDLSEFKVLPAAYYTPETGVAIELFAYRKFFADSVFRPSNIRFFFAVTQRRQVIFDLPWQIFTAKEGYRVDGKLDLRVFPEYFYGIGNNTVESVRELYSFTSLGVVNSIHKKLFSDVFIGALAELRMLNTSLPSLEGTVSEPMVDVHGGNGYQLGRAGFCFLIDSRDNFLCPTKGTYVESTLTCAITNVDAVTGQFTRLLVDARKYQPMWKGSTIAGQLLGVLHQGSVPFRELAALGGPHLHRGYYFGRFRDQHALLVQAEVRQQVFWRIGVVAFASAGRVYHTVSQMPGMRDVHPAAGGGLRFRIGKHDGTNLRFDYSATPDSRGFYIFFAEAF